MVRSRVALLGLASLIALPAIGFAESPDWEQKTVQMAVHDDLYIGGGTINVTQPVIGDLVIAGGTVHISAPVGTDILATGGQVDIGSDVGDDVRAAGGTIRISGHVTGDVIVAGGSVILEKTSVVDGDVVVFAGDIDIEGTIAGKLKAAGGNVDLNGSVGGGAEIDAGMFSFNGPINGQSRLVAEEIHVGPNARLQGAADYWTREGEIDFSTALQGGSGATFNMSLARQDDEREKVGVAAAIISGWTLFSLLSSALLLLVLLLAFPGTFRAAADRLRVAPWASLLTGFLYFAAFPVLAVLLIVSIIGIPLGVAAIAIYVFSIFFASAVTSLVLTRWSERMMKAKWNPVIVFMIAMAILIVLKVLWLVPVLGWAIKLVAGFMTMGALLHSVWSRSRNVA